MGHVAFALNAVSGAIVPTIDAASPGSMNVLLRKTSFPRCSTDCAPPVPPSPAGTPPLDPPLLDVAPLPLPPPLPLEAVPPLLAVPLLAPPLLVVLPDPPELEPLLAPPPDPPDPPDPLLALAPPLDPPDPDPEPLPLPRLAPPPLSSDEPHRVETRPNTTKETARNTGRVFMKFAFRTCRKRRNGESNERAR
jgi:hypothetical protein